MPPRLPPFGASLGPAIFARVRRAHPDFSARAFAAHLGVSVGLMSEWETGEAAIPFGVAYELARYLHDTVAVFGDVLLRLDHEAVPLPMPEGEHAEVDAAVEASRLAADVMEAAADGKVTPAELEALRPRAEAAHEATGRLLRVVGAGVRR